MIRNIVLVGLSGSGKSSTARELATNLGWDAVDTDALIEHRTGRTIPDLFRSDGETAFRAVEAGILREAISRDRVVIATGGGAVVDPAIWSDALLGGSQSLVFWLDASPAHLVERLKQQADRDGTKANRPLLEGDPIARMTAMLEARSPMYSRADVTLEAEHRGVREIAADIAEMTRLASGEDVRVNLEVESAASTIRVGQGGRHRLHRVIRERWPGTRRVWVVTDGHLEEHAEDLSNAMRLDGGLEARTITVPPGETSKSLSELSRLYDWMLGGGVERSDVVVALGGGMVGDLGGFAAASVLRGIGLVQVPTTLLAMVDSSVGGKTAVNHAAGKNLIGAFYQPREVVIDPDFLGTLPARELRSGWAEIVKHAVIEPSTPVGHPPILLDALERNTVALRALRQPLLSWLIRRNVSLKASVVSADEREAGIRAYLNLGHTIGHGIEAAGYELLHGEAIAVGLRAALGIAVELDLVDDAFADRIGRLLSNLDLPTVAEVDPGVVRQKMASDKKRVAGAQKWVLPTREGGVRIVSGISSDTVDRAISSVAIPRATALLDRP